MDSTGKDNFTSAAIADLGDLRLAPVSSADAVYELLRSLILDGRLEPGQRLREVEVSKSLGVSRTQLREAFTRLLSDRLLEKTSTGVIVSDTKTRLDGIRAIRIALEGYATRLAVKNLTEEDFAYLERTIEIAKALPIEAVTERVRNNTAFHRRIFDACGVPELHDAIEGYAGFFMSESNLAALNREQSREAIEDHIKLVAAIKARDADEAERIMRFHVTRGFNNPTRV